jgi:hypothetical protein
MEQLTSLAQSLQEKRQAISSVVAAALPKRDIAVAGKWALTRRIMA